VHSLADFDVSQYFDLNTGGIRWLLLVLCRELARAAGWRTDSLIEIEYRVGYRTQATRNKIQDARFKMQIGIVEAASTKHEARSTKHEAERTRNTYVIITDEARMVTDRRAPRERLEYRILKLAPASDREDGRFYGGCSDNVFQS
jgi:hypothetical protein